MTPSTLPDSTNFKRSSMRRSAIVDIMNENNFLTAENIGSKSKTIAEMSKDVGQEDIELEKELYDYYEKVYQDFKIKMKGIQTEWYERQMQIKKSIDKLIETNKRVTQGVRFVVVDDPSDTKQMVIKCI